MYFNSFMHVSSQENPQEWLKKEMLNFSHVQILANFCVAE